MVGLPDWFNWYGLPPSPHARVVNLLVTISIVNSLLLFLWLVDKIFFHIQLKRLLGRILRNSENVFLLLQTTKEWAALGKDYREDAKNTLHHVHEDVMEGVKKVDQKTEEIKTTIVKAVQGGIEAVTKDDRGPSTTQPPSLP
jgi:hypothetical protein